MFTLITLAAWQVAALGAVIAALLALWIHARHWSAKRLVMVSVFYKDGARKDFFRFSWQLKELYNAIAGNPTIPRSCTYYDSNSLVEMNHNVTHVMLFLPENWRWEKNICLTHHFTTFITLWDWRHALLVNVLRDFGLDDNQPMSTKLLSICSNQRLDAVRMDFALNDPSRARELTNDEVAYLERLGECLRAAVTNKWTREVRLNRFNGKLPGTNELVMELIATSEGAERVVACINRDWQPEPIKTRLTYHETPQS